MSSPPRLAISITMANGRVYRWGGDEPDATAIPDDLTFSTAVPGGFKNLACSLLRRIDLTYADEQLFATVRVYGPGNETVWEGRIAQLPKSHGDSYATTPGAVGWSAHLGDDPSFRELYVDRDMTHWTEAPLERRRQLASAGVPQGKVPVMIGSGGIQWLPPNEALPTTETTEVFYDAGVGLAVSKVQYRGTRTGTFTSFEAANIYGDSAVIFPSGTTIALTLDNAIHTAQPFSAGDRYAMLRTRTTGAVTPAVGHEQSFDLLAVFGDHGLPLQAVSGDAHGIFASDLITDIIQRAAPLLSTTGIDTTDYPVPHAVFSEPTNAENAITLINGYHAWDWGVWEDRAFFYRAPDPSRLTWEARLSDGARLDLEGDTAEQIFTGVVVYYQDGTGTTKSVGPPASYWNSGTALVDDTDAALVDTSSENPANAYGITRWETLNLSVPTNLAGATTLGVVWLAEHSLPQRRGSLTLTSTVKHPTKGPRPVCEVRAGDYIKIADHSNSVARKIIETSYSYGSDQITLTLDNTAPKLEALLERLGAGGRIGRF